MPPSVLYAIVDRTVEITFRGVVTYTLDERTTDGGVFGGNTLFSITCSDGGSFTSVSTCSEPHFFFRRGCERRDHWLESCGIVITWETGTARHLGSFFVASTTGFAPLTSRERLQPRRTIRGIITRGVVSLLATEQPFAFVHISHRWHYFCALTSIFAGMFGGVRLRAPAGGSTRVSNTKRTKSWTYDLPGLDNRKYCCFNARRGTSFDESGKTRHLQIRPELPSELNVVCSVGHSDSYPYEMASFHSESQMQSGQNWESVTWPS